MNLNLNSIKDQSFTAEPSIGVHNCKLIALEDTKVIVNMQQQDALLLKFEVDTFGEQEMIIKTEKQLKYQMRVILAQLNIPNITIGKFIELINKQPKLKVQYQEQTIDTEDGKILWKSFTFDVRQSESKEELPVDDLPTLE